MWVSCVLTITHETKMGQDFSVEDFRHFQGFHGINLRSGLDRCYDKGNICWCFFVYFILFLFCFLFFYFLLVVCLLLLLFIFVFIFIFVCCFCFFCLFCFVLFCFILFYFYLFCIARYIYAVWREKVTFICSSYILIYTFINCY